MIKKLTNDDKKTILRMVLCVAIGIPLGALAGVDTTYCATTALTATLLLHTDRGHFGTLIYSLRRFLVQFIMGTAVLLMVFLFDAIQMDGVKLWLQFLMLAVPIVLIGQIAYHKLVPQYRYSPYVCTLSNAILILGPALLQHKGLFLHRIYATVLGIALGLFIKYVLVQDKNRASRILELLQNDFKTFEAGILSKDPEHFTQLDDKNASAMLAMLHADGNSRWERYGAANSMLVRLDNLLMAQKRLQEILQYRATYDVSEPFSRETECLLTDLLSIHKKVLFSENQVSMPTYEQYHGFATNNQEVILAAAVLRYADVLQMLVSDL